MLVIRWLPIGGRQDSIPIPIMAMGSGPSPTPSYTDLGVLDVMFGPGLNVGKTSKVDRIYGCGDTRTAQSWSAVVSLEVTSEKMVEWEKGGLTMILRVSNR